MVAALGFAGGFAAGNQDDFDDGYGIGFKLGYTQSILDAVHDVRQFRDAVWNEYMLDEDLEGTITYREVDRAIHAQLTYCMKEISGNWKNVK